MLWCQTLELEGRSALNTVLPKSYNFRFRIIVIYLETTSAFTIVSCLKYRLIDNRAVEKQEPNRNTNVPYIRPAKVTSTKYNHGDNWEPDMPEASSPTGTDVIYMPKNRTRIQITRRGSALSFLWLGPKRRTRLVSYLTRKRNQSLGTFPQSGIRKP